MIFQAGKDGPELSIQKAPTLLAVPLHGDTFLCPPGQYAHTGKPARNKSLHGQKRKRQRPKERCNGKNWIRR